MPELSVIAYIRNDYKSKFGIPRQSGLVEGENSVIVFEPAFAQWDAVRGIEQFDRLWLIWGFSAADYDNRSLTVRPPRLGGNTRMGVFATRSPFRPNSLGLSCVRLLNVEADENGKPTVLVSGADLLDGTPVYDIKPYLAYADSFPDASDGFSLSRKDGILTVNINCNIPENVDKNKIDTICRIISQDPRPQYQDDSREYSFDYGGLNIKFVVNNSEAEITCIDFSKEV